MTMFVTVFNIIFIFMIMISPSTGSLVQLSTCHSSLSPRMHMLNKEIVMMMAAKVMMVTITFDSDDDDNK